MRLLVIGLVWPESASSAAGSRMLQLLDLFIGAGFEVHFGSAAQHSEHTDPLESMGINTHSLQLNDDAFDAFAKNLQPDFVLFDRFVSEEQFGWRVAENCPNALRILDTEDLHCLRQARQHALKQNREPEPGDLMSDMAKREVAAILRSDLTLMISAYEMALLQDFFRIDPALLHYLPFLQTPITIEEQQAWLPFAMCSDFMFIGNFHHDPNRDAVLYLKTKIWPLIREILPQAVIRIYGAYMPPPIVQLNNPKQGFLVCGRAESAKTVIAGARVMLAPLRFGAGMKGKLLEAMRYGTPSVTTAIGAEAMTPDGSWNGYICESDVEFAEAATRLYQHKALWETARQTGVTLFNSGFDRHIFGSALITDLAKRKENLEVSRQQNFVGAVLLHQTAAATKYLSRWIQEKNKHKGDCQ